VICVDASLVGAWLLPEELSEKAVQLRDAFRSAGDQLIAPTLLVPEVTTALRKAVFRKRIDAEFGEEAFSAFVLLPIDLHEVRDLAADAWSWAKTLNAPRLYDMYYLALAERLECELWTADRRFVRLAGDRSKRVRWIGDLSFETDQ
jgi:predicted nucleic acid-binding protein